MISLRSRLLIIIFLVLLMSSGLVSLLAFLTAQEELTDLLDENMQQVAIAIAMQESDYKYQNPKTKQILSEQGDFLIQVWDIDGKLHYTSHPTNDLPMLGTKNFGVASFEGKDWRYYIHESGNRKIQIVQPMSERREDLLEFVAQFLTPIAIQFPVAIILAYLLIGKGLKPLAVASESISRKNPHSLSPIILDSVPLEIRALVQSLNDLLLRLDVALRHQRQFTADAAHELNTPLSVIKLHLDILDRADTKIERQEAQTKLRAGVERGIELVSNLLTLARNEPGIDELILTRTDLAQVVRAAVEEASFPAKEKSIHLHYLGDEGPLNILGDATTLPIMIGNIIRNAILYTQQGGEVMVSVRHARDDIIISVKDNGMGIALEHREHIFNRFYRVLGTQQFGSGLGLAIAKSIADQNSIRISIHDGLGGSGTEFRMTVKEIPT